MTHPFSFHHKVPALVFLFSMALSVQAGGIAFIEEESQSDIVRITDPEVVSVFYGELRGFPHTFEIIATESFRLTVEIAVPDIKTAENSFSGMIVRELEESGRVEEVARLSAEGAGWEPSYDLISGDGYRNGPAFDADVREGVYRIEVSTPDNIGKYILTIGYDEEKIGYIERLRTIAAVKEFFGKSKLLIIESPLIYVPLLVLVLSGLAYLRMRRRRPVL